MLDKINSIEELYEYMDNNIKYGWYGIDGVVRENSLKGFKEYYKTMSIDDIIKYGVGTCPDYVNLIKYYLDNNNIKNKIYAITGYENVNGVNKERVHFMIFYNVNNKWFQFEQASRFFKGMFEYQNEDDLKNTIVSKYNNILSNIVLIELDSIPIGIGYDELSKIILDKIGNV